MSLKMKVLLDVVLLGFLALTWRAIAEVGYLGFFEAIDANAATQLLAWDLVICLALICTWMVRDARARGGTAWPFVLIAATFGAAGPLLYLLIGRRAPAVGAGRDRPAVAGA